MAQTPGPWRIGNANLLSFDGYTGKPFRNVWAGEDLVVARCVDNGNCDDDARLIAAAPELLALCKAALGQWPESLSFELRDRMEAAVARAEAQPPPATG